MTAAKPTMASLMMALNCVSETGSAWSSATHTAAAASEPARIFKRSGRISRMPRCRNLRLSNQYIANMPAVPVTEVASARPGTPKSARPTKLSAMLATTTATATYIVVLVSCIEW